MRRLLTITVIVAVAAPVAVALNPRDQRLAYRAQTRLSDLPVGWRTSKDTDSSASKCIPAVVHPTGKSARDFAKGDIAQIRTLVGIYRSESEARRAFANATNDKAFECFAKELRNGKNAPKSVDQGRIQLRRIGSPAIGREIVAVFEDSGLRLTAYIHFDVAHKGRGVVALYDADVASAPLQQNQEEALLRRMLSRLP